MKKPIRWNRFKSDQLRSERGFGFEDVENALASKPPLYDGPHPSQEYAHQRMFIVEIEAYPVCVPYVETNDEIFLKTAYRNRKLKK